MKTLKSKIENLQKRLNNTCNTVTFVDVAYDPEFREIALTGDGSLAIKGVFNRFGTKVKIVKCPGFQRKMEGKVISKIPDRDIATIDYYSFKQAVISFQEFEDLCIRYKKAWKIGALHEKTA